MPVNTSQRFNWDHPCPVCGGFDKINRGRGARCYGFLSENGMVAHCTNTAYGGTLSVNTSSDT